MCIPPTPTPLHSIFSLTLCESNSFKKRSNSNLPKQDRIIFNFAFDLWWSSEVIYWWEMHCCPNKLCFLSHSMESFKHKKQLQLFLVVDRVEWVVFEMLMWETWSLLPAEPQTSWVTLSFPLSFLLHLEKKTPKNLNCKIRIHPPFCADTQSISETSAAWDTAVLMQSRWCWPPVWKW